MEIGKIYMPFGEAVRIALEDIRRRFVRAAITTASVVLGVAFMDALLILAAIARVLGGEGAGVQAYQLWILFISLLVCVVGIMNSMLIAVAERTREIGTWKCLGALDKHVLLLFLIEALLIGVIGGLLGWVIGLLVAVIYGTQVGMSTVMSALSTSSVTIAGLEFLPTAISTFVLSIVLAVFLSLVASLYPAYRAAKLNPAEALRYEV